MCVCEWEEAQNVNSTPAAESTCPSPRGRCALAPQNPERVYYLCSLSASAKIQRLLCLFILYCNWRESRKWERKDYIWSDTKALFQWGKRAAIFSDKGVWVWISYVVRWQNFSGLRLSPSFFLMTLPHYLFTQPVISQKDQTTHSHTPSHPPTYGFTATV